MSLLLSSSRRTRMVRHGQIASTAVVCAALLSGCAIWPKALTFWGKDEAPPSDMATAPAAAAPNAPAAAEAPPAVTSSAVAEPAKPEVVPMTSLPPEPKPVAAPAAPAKPAGPMKMEKGFYINVGLFADESNARKAQSRLLNEGLPAFRQTLDSAKGTRTRVRVGPFASRSEAESAASSIRALALDAVIFQK